MRILLKGLFGHIKVRKLLGKIPVIPFNVNTFLYKGRFKSNANGIRKLFEIFLSKFSEIFLKKVKGFFRNTPAIKPFINHFQVFEKKIIPKLPFKYY